MHTSKKSSFRQFLIKKRISIVPPSYAHRRVNGIDLFIQKIGLIKTAKKQFSFGKGGLTFQHHQQNNHQVQKIEQVKISAKEVVHQNGFRDKVQNVIPKIHVQFIPQKQEVDFSTKLTCNDPATQNFIRSLSGHKEERKDRKRKSFYEPRKARVNDN